MFVPAADHEKYDKGYFFISPFHMQKQEAEDAKIAENMEKQAACIGTKIGTKMGPKKNCRSHCYAIQYNKL